jgi:hypothetical protein
MHAGLTQAGQEGTRAQINWTLFSIVSGGMYFKEFEEFSADQAVLFVLGVSIVLAGVILLSWSPQHPPRMPTSYGNMDMDEDDLELDTSTHSPSAARKHGAHLLPVA